MKIGEAVLLKASCDIDANCYYSITENDYDAIEISEKTLTAKSIGTAKIRVYSIAEPSRFYYCEITVTSDDFTGNAIEYKLLGTWNSSESGNKSYIVFNADKTGSMKVYIDTTIVQDTTFDWRCYVSGSSNILVIENSPSSYINSNYGITFLKTTTPQFSLNGYLAFGLPQTTNWIKQ